MRIYISEPSDVPQCALYDRLRDRWARLAGDQLIMHKAQYPGELHGDRLVRLWQDIYVAERAGPGKADPQALYLITENDFLIDPDFLKLLRRWPWEGTKAIVAPYQTRAQDLTLRDWRKPDDGCPLVGAWFLAFHLDEFTWNWPPVDWLGPRGPCNDAANYAYYYGLSSGFWQPQEVAWLWPRSLAPRFMGVDYYLDDVHAGLHTFWAREFSQPPGTVLLPQLPAYTAGVHVARINEYLDRVDHDASK